MCVFLREEKTTIMRANEIIFNNCCLIKKTCHLYLCETKLIG